MRVFATLLLAALTCRAAGADDAKARIRGIHDYAKQGPSAIPKIQPYLEDRDKEVRWAAVEAISEIGTQRALDPLIQATNDEEESIQVRAVDGLVNFYLPGYLKTGIGGSIRRATRALKGRFSDTNNDIIDPYVSVRPEVITAIGRLARGGVTMESRANAARALGILRGKAALPDLYEALRSRGDIVLFESLIAIQKIRDTSSGPHIQFLLRDLKDRVQIAALETTGILRNRAAIPDLRQAVRNARNDKIRRAALTALAMMPDEGNRPLFAQYFASKDDGLRAAAAEGYGRLGQASDLPAIEKAFQDEEQMGPRLSMAFAVVMLGKHELTEFSALQYLVNTLNSRLYRDSAEPLLAELARDPQVCKAIYPALRKPDATREEKIRLLRILGRTGGKDTLPVVEPLKSDSDTEVALEATRAAQNITARLPRKPD
ncbi:MAG: HEAT repeat domain-containing protein [Bryobacterales bacterium]|nr:HEAT repeat domain-containing protein [Bryobacterales bacterium]